MLRVPIALFFCFVGETPRCFLKKRDRWACDENPINEAISFSECGVVVSSRSISVVMRSSITDFGERLAILRVTCPK